MSAKKYMENANESVKILTVFAEDFPIIGMVATACKKVYSLADQATTNKEDCKKVSERCRTIETIITNVAKNLQQAKADMTQDSLIQGAESLLKKLEEMEELVQNYITKGRIGRIIGGDTFKVKYESIDKDIDAAIQVLQLGLNQSVLEQNSKLLEMLDKQGEIERVQAELEACKEKLRQQNVQAEVSCPESAKRFRLCFGYGLFQCK